MGLNIILDMDYKLLMKAAVYREKADPPVLHIVDIPRPSPSAGEVLVRVEYIGVNPIDYWISGGRYPLRTRYGIVGSECYGVVEEVGEGVEDLRPGDPVSIYPWLHCGRCGYCKSGLQQLCVNGGLVGGKIDGCYAEYVLLPVNNVYKVGSEGSGEAYATAGVSALTAIHAVNMADVREGERVLVYGASGNVGMYILQYSKLRGAEVYGVSRWEWIKDYGADHRVDRDGIGKLMDEGIRFDVIFNSMGGNLFSDSIDLLEKRGRIVTFGGLTSMESILKIAPLYRRELKIIGSTGGTIEEFKQVLSDLESGRIKPKIWRIYKLDDAQDALRSLFSVERSGKILIKTL